MKNSLIFLTSLFVSSASLAECPSAESMATQIHETLSPVAQKIVTSLGMEKGGRADFTVELKVREVEGLCYYSYAKPDQAFFSMDPINLPSGTQCPRSSEIQDRMFPLLTTDLAQKIATSLGMEKGHALFHPVNMQYMRTLHTSGNCEYKNQNPILFQMTKLDSK